MKKILFLTTFVFSVFLLNINVFAYQFPTNFNFVKAGKMLEDLAVDYTEPNYFVSRYPNTNGVMQQNYGWEGALYPIGYRNGTNIQCIMVSTTPFQSVRYDADGNFVSNQSALGNTQTGALLTENTNWNSIGGNDIKLMLLNTDKTWYVNTYTITNSNVESGQYSYNFNVYASADDFLAALYNNHYDVPGYPGGTGTGVGSSGDLPFLSFTLTKKIAPVVSGIVPSAGTKEIFSWDYKQCEPYASAPQDYTFDIIAYANFHDVTTSLGTTVNVFDPNNFEPNNTNKIYVSRGGYNIAVNEYSFMYKDVGFAVYNRSNKTFTDDSVNSATEGYILGIRTRNNANTQFSFYKLFIVQAGGYVTSTGKVITNDGRVIDTSADNGDDGMGTTGGSQGTGGYTGDGSTSSSDDTTGQVYDETSKVNIGTLIGTLKSLVNGIGNIPSILSQLLTFLPEWLTSMIVVSIGLFVVIGLVKMIAR